MQCIIGFEGSIHSFLVRTMRGRKVKIDRTKSGSGTVTGVVERIVTAYPYQSEETLNFHIEGQGTCRVDPYRDVITVLS